MLSTEKSFEIFLRHNEAATISESTISESFALFLMIYTPLTNNYF